MQICIAKQKLDYIGCERYCAQLPVFGQFADNPTILAVALSWQGNTYGSFYHLQDKAIPILTSALSNAKDSRLLTTTVYSDLPRAYSLDTTQEDYERKARNYSELAHSVFPSHPELDPHYNAIQVSSSELYQFDGVVYLNLSKSLANSKYAQMAYDTFSEAMVQKAMNPHYSCSLLIRKADAASALGDMDEVVNCLTRGLVISVDIGSQQKIGQIQTVLHQIPEKWQKETSVQNLQKKLDHALIVARR